MRIPLQFYDTLRNVINLSDVVKTKVNLTRKGGEFSGLCPFHLEKTPSFTVSDPKKFYHCFGCGAHGDVIKFTCETQGLAYQDAAIKLAGDYGIELPKLTREQELLYEESDEIYSILELAAGFFKSSHTSESLKYLKQRGIDEKVIDNFQIGFAPAGSKLQQFFAGKSIPLANLVKAGLAGKRDDGRIYEIFHDRIMFPIRNIYNKIIGFGGRVIGETLPKYINSPETLVFKKNETLYGENTASPAAYKKNYIIVVEGYLDVIALHRTGYSETVASLGTAVTENHLNKLWKALDEIVICLDGDAAGFRASSRLINIALPIVNATKKISFVLLPQGSDPDDIATKNDPKLFQELVDKRISLSEMIWKSEYEQKNYTNAENRALLETTLENYTKLIKDKILSKNYHRFFQEQIWLNLVKRQGKAKENASQIGKALTNFKVNHTEMEALENALCSMMVKFPEIMQDELRKNFILNLNLADKQLSDFRDWFLTNLDQNHDKGLKYIEETIKNTGFYNSFLLLIKPEKSLLDKSFDDNIEPQLLWELLHKKYYLASLKAEYTSIMQSDIEDSFKKAVLYQEEIIKISKELQKLNESFFKY